MTLYFIGGPKDGRQLEWSDSEYPEVFETCITSPGLFSIETQIETVLYKRIRWRADEMDWSLYVVDGMSMEEAFMQLMLKYFTK